MAIRAATMKATTHRPLPRQRRDGSQDLIGNVRICNGAQIQACLAAAQLTAATASSLGHRQWRTDRL
jgi:hypothetical protein